MTTIQELINELSKYDPNEEVIATWEGIIREVDIYRAKDGTVMIDADENNYKDRFVSGEWNPRTWIYSGDDR